MKKSLLTLALAALASTAFAANVYETKDFTVAVTGSASYNLSKNVDLHRRLDTDYGFLTDKKNGERSATYAADLGLNITYLNDKGYTTGFDALVGIDYNTQQTSKHTYVFTTESKDKVAKDMAEWENTTSDYVKPFVKSAYFFIGRPEFGYLNVGTTGTVAGVPGASLNNTNVTGGFISVGSAQKVVKYTFPTWNENLTIAYSFANDFNKKDFDYTRQNAFTVAYTFPMVELGFAASYQNGYKLNETFSNTFDATNRVKEGGIYAKFSVPGVEGLALTTNYVFTSDKNYAGMDLTKKQYTNSGLVDVSYNLFDIATPYMGYAVSHMRTKELGNGEFTVADRHDIYAGISASYALVNDVTVSAYLEGKFGQERKRTNQVATTSREKSLDRNFALGVSLSF